jgi:AcrR family transcriptional regulator
MSIDTKEHILDAAESLIAEKGIDAVSLRAITTAANVSLAAVNYHFGSKNGLIEKVFERRIEPLNRRRLELLDKLEAAAGDGPLPLEDVLRALIGPAIRLYQGDERTRRFMRVCAKIYSEPAEGLTKIFDDLFREILVRFNDAFDRALPEADVVERAWSLHFTAGAMIHTMLDSERIRRYSQGVCDPSDSEGVIERMVRFAAAGMRAAVARDMAEESAVALAMEAPR